MAETMNFTSIRNARLAKESEEQKTNLRKRNLLVLIFDYLSEMGYTDTCQSLESEAQFEMNQYVACDNIDLDTILQEFESYYYIRFQKYPKLVKKITEGSDAKKKIPPLKCIRKSKDANSVNPSVNDKVEPHRRAISCLPNLNNSSKPECKDSQELPSKADFNLVGQRIHTGFSTNESTSSNINSTKKLNANEKDSQFDPSFRLLKPLGGFCYNSEWKELAEIISQDIYQQNPNVHWDDIIGQDQAKHLIKEAVVYPIKYPQLFTGILSPWKGILLYGPPGTGKTMLAKALATECKTTFFNISASTIVSKWRGDSEKLVRIMFELARYHAPSTIFLDELDSLMSHRQTGLQSRYVQNQGTFISAFLSPSLSEHEGSRRMKTEILIQMDGLARSDDLVFLLAASNIPWELDYAMLRRLEKRILVDLPNDHARTALFHHYLPPVICSKGGLHFTSELDYQKLSEISEGYSGADIQLVCKEAAMQRMRKVIELLEFPTKDKEVPNLTLEGIKTEEVESALERTKPSAKNLAQKYLKWKNTFGSS